MIKGSSEVVVAVVFRPVVEWRASLRLTAQLGIMVFILTAAWRAALSVTLH